MCRPEGVQFREASTRTSPTPTAKSDDVLCMSVIMLSDPLFALPFVSCKDFTFDGLVCRRFSAKLDHTESSQCFSLFAARDGFYPFNIDATSTARSISARMLTVLGAVGDSVLNR